MTVILTHICTDCRDALAAEPHMYDLEAGAMNPANCGAKTCDACDVTGCEEVREDDHSGNLFCTDCMPICRCPECDPDYARDLRDER